MHSTEVDRLSAPASSFPANSFWETHRIELGQAARFVLDPLTLCAIRHEQEWRLVWWRSGDPLEVAHVEIGPEQELLADAPSDAKQTRVAFAMAPDQLTLIPSLADRLVVARPDVALSLLSREMVRLYLSTPVWLGLRVDDKTGGAPSRMLWEQAVARPSDTWFGESTTAGELAYASRTHARLELDEVDWLPQRVVTEVLVKNDATDPLDLERLSIPVRALSVHIDDDGRLWSPSVELVNTSDGSLADVRVRGVPKEAGSTREIGPARDPEMGNPVIRAFAALFRG